MINSGNYIGARGCASLEKGIVEMKQLLTCLTIDLR
jgi:hypothetical protein